MRGISRAFGISRNTLSTWLKKKARQSPTIEATLVAPQTDREVLELDEMWSFVGKRRHKRWVWLALCQRTRQIVAFAIGRRDDLTCQRLWSAIPAPYRAVAQCLTDHWESYANVLPRAQHRSVAKKQRLTNHIERFNNTVRQRLGRLTRKTLAFSKSEQMHERVLRLFVIEYNRQRKVALNLN